MVFSSIEFIFLFFPVFMAVYYIISNKGKNLWIVLGSLAFFSYGMWSEPIHILFLLISVLVNYLIALVISENDKRKKLWLIFGLIYNFARLALYKYLDTAIVAVNNIFSLDIPLTNLSMPIGISFYTFCAAAYLVDVYRNSIQAERSIIKFGSYMLFFPKFISGPITRYSDMNEDLVLPKTSFNMFDDGLREFIIGLGLKVLIANQLAGIWNAVGTIGYESISTPLAWFGIIGYSLQLYFDFYGYSLMAIGLGRMMGFHLPKNFDYPYISRSMTEFWRRWHMTLGSWFRDYVYIPLGGSRKGMGFTIFNMLVVWVFTGIWHGAGGNFVIWGLFLFLLITIEKLGLKKILDKFKAVGHIYMIIIIPISWLIFAIGDLDKIAIYLARLFPFFGSGENVWLGDFAKYFSKYAIVFIIGLFLCMPFARRIFDKKKSSIVVTIVLILIFWASIYCIYMGMNDPFMYFSF